MKDSGHVTDSIVGAGFALISGAGHLPAVEAPMVVADALERFLERVG